MDTQQSSKVYLPQSHERGNERSEFSARACRTVHISKFNYVKKARCSIPPTETVIFHTHIEPLNHQNSARTHKAMLRHYLATLLARISGGSASGRRGAPVSRSTGIFKALLGGEWLLQFSRLCHGSASPRARPCRRLHIRQGWSIGCGLRRGGSFLHHISSILRRAILNRGISYTRAQEFSMAHYQIP